MGRPRKNGSTTTAAPAGELQTLRGFAGSASAIDTEYREALEEIERTTFAPELKQSLEEKLAKLVREKLAALCARESKDLAADPRDISSRSSHTAESETLVTGESASQSEPRVVEHERPAS